MDTLLQDLRFGFQSLRKRPLFAVIAIGSLGLGIGSATTMFSVVNTVLIDSVPFSRGNRLVNVWLVAEGARNDPGLIGRTWDRLPLSQQQYRDWQAANTAFEALAVHNGIQTTLTTSDGADRIWMGTGSASLLSVLDVQPALGRWFRPEEEGATAGSGAAPVTVISHEMWQARWGGNPAVLGTTVNLDGRDHTVIGVLPPGFRLRHLGMHWLGADSNGRRDAWVTIGTPSFGRGNNLEAIGRLAPKVADDRAIAELTRILEKAKPGTLVRLASRSSDETDGLTSPLLLLLGATGLLLVIGCANVAALSMGELVTRRRELATRLALGAPARRIARQLLTENLVLGFFGSLLGIGLALAGTRLMVVIGPPLPRLDAVRLDLRVLAFAVAVGITAVLASGTLPALVSARRSRDTLRFDPMRSATRRRSRLERLVVATEVALTVVLLIVGGLLRRSLSRLLAVDPGFDPAGLATARVAFAAPPVAGSGGARPSLAEIIQREREASARVYTEILPRLQALPGVSAASASTRLPFPGETNTSTVSIVERDGTTRQFSAQIERVTTGYHETLRIPLREGRVFTNADTASAPRVLVISENVARRYWPGQSPICARIRGLSPDEATIVGVAGNVKRNSLGVKADPVIWLPLMQPGGLDLRPVVRTAGDPGALLPAIRRVVKSVDAGIPVTELSTVPALIRASASNERYRMLLMTVFGALGCALAAVGVFGVSARSVAQRSREFGIRLALGAEHRRLMGQVLSESIVLGAVGIAVGLAAALALGRTLSGFLFGIVSWDPVTYGAVIVLVLGMIVAASLVPVRRVTRLAPADVLRHE